MIETYKVFDWLAHSDDTRLATFKKQTLFWELIKCIRTSFKNILVRGVDLLYF